MCRAVSLVPCLLACRWRGAGPVWARGAHTGPVGGGVVERVTVHVVKPESSRCSRFNLASAFSGVCYALLHIHGHMGHIPIKRG